MIGSLCTLIDMHRTIFVVFFFFVLFRFSVGFTVAIECYHTSMNEPQHNIKNDEQKKYTIQIGGEDSKK